MACARFTLSNTSSSRNFQYTMSHPNVAVLTTTTLQTTPSPPPRLKTFVRSAIKQYGLTEQKLRKRAAKRYGSLEYAMQAMETAEAENKAAIERAFPNGYAEIQVGMSAVAFLNLKSDFHRVPKSVQVLSIEQSLEKAKATSLYSDATKCDPNFVHEDTILLITQQNHSDRFSTYPYEPLTMPL